MVAARTSRDVAGGTCAGFTVAPRGSARSSSPTLISRAPPGLLLSDAPATGCAGPSPPDRSSRHHHPAHQAALTTTATVNGAYGHARRSHPLRSRRHRRRPGRLRRRARTPPPPASTSPSSRWTRSAARASTAAASRPRRSSRRPRCTATSPTPPSSASRPSAPDRRLRHRPRPASRRSSTASSRASPALMKAPQGHDLRRHRHARARPHRHGRRRPTARRRSSAATTWSSPPARCPGRSPASSVGGPIMTSDEVLDARPRAGAGGRHRRRRDRLRVRLDVRRPRRAGHDPRGAAEDPPRARQRRRQRRGAQLQEEEHRHPHRRARSPATRPTTTGGTTVHFGERRARSRSTPSSSSVGRRPFADKLGLDGTGGQGRRARLRRGRRVLPHRRATASTPSATSSTRRSSPTSASPRRSWSIKQILGETPMPVDYDRVPWAIYCHPEVAFAGPARRRAKDAGYDVVVAKHQFRATAGRRSSARPTGW